MHCCVKGGKYGNPSKILNVKSKITLKKGKQYKLKPKMKTDNKACLYFRPFRYETDNKKIAVVTKKGVVKAKKKGKCNIYVYAQNGLFKKVVLKVK